MAENAELDAAVQKSTEQRKEENSFHTTAMAENAMAMQLLNKAKAKLAAVYASKEPSLLEVRRSDSAKSDPDAQINAMLGLSFLQVSEKGEDMLSQSLAALSGTEPPPPPEATSYGKKTAAGMDYGTHERAHLRLEVGGAEGADGGGGRPEGLRGRPGQLPGLAGGHEQGGCRDADPQGGIGGEDA